MTFSYWLIFLLQRLVVEVCTRSDNAAFAHFVQRCDESQKRFEFREKAPCHTRQHVAATCPRDILQRLVAWCVPTFTGASYTAFLNPRHVNAIDRGMVQIFYITQQFHYMASFQSKLLLPTPGIIKISRKITVNELLMIVKAPVVIPSATGYVDSTVSS